MPNITDVADLAGVSRQTVSRVLNDENTVTPATRARVENAIRQLNYRPSAAARALVTRKTRTIGLITTGAPLYGPSGTMLGFNEAARAAGYRVSTASMGSADRAAILDAIEVLLGQNVEALVLIAADYDALEAVSDLEIGIPLVTAESSGRPGFHSVSIDQFGGARQVTEHLVALGHRDILHLAGPTGSVDATERIRGWRSVLDEHGLVAAAPVVGTWYAESGYRLGVGIAADIASGRSPATAIFSSNDQMAIGLLHALSDAGLAVPGRVSVAGFDDMPESAHFSPPLTTVRQDFVDLGARMMANVLARLAGQVPSDAAHSMPELVERASTGRVATPG